MTDIFETVKSQVKIADVVEYFGVKLNSRDKGLCPFHREKTASFSVDRKNNIFTCFGCGETGDVITFVSKIKDIARGDLSYRRAGCKTAKAEHKKIPASLYERCGQDGLFRKAWADRRNGQKVLFGVRHSPECSRPAVFIRVDILSNQEHCRQEVL